jgi:hypothetical protein
MLLQEYLIFTAKGAKDAKKSKLIFAILAFFAVKNASLCRNLVKETTEKKFTWRAIASRFRL